MNHSALDSYLIKPATGEVMAPKGLSAIRPQSVTLRHVHSGVVALCFGGSASNPASQVANLICVLTP